MKRKLKLLASLCSLGLSLALMTFGVFAATSHTLTISSTVSFSIGQNINCSVDGKTFVQTSAPAYSTIGNITTLGGATGAVGDGTLSKTSWSALTSEQGKMTVDKQAIYWVFEVKNSAPANANSFVAGIGNDGSTADSFTALTLDAELATSYNLDIKYGTSKDSVCSAEMVSGFTAKIQPKNTVYILVKVSPKEITTNITSKPFNFTLVLKYSE